MFTEERLDQIINLLREKRKVIVKELSNRFGVTEDCIRKDLKILEREGLIKRTYGGAVLKRIEAENSYILSRTGINSDQKQNIAEKAFNMITPMETIFLDISTTNLLIARKIAAGSKKLTIVTNMIDIVSCFTNNSLVEVVCVGGVFNKNLNGFTGSAAIKAIEQYKFNKAFIGCCGVDMLDKSISTFEIEDGTTKKAILKSSKKSYLVMDSQKFYIDGVYNFATLDDFNGIILDEKPEDKLFTELEKLGLEVVY